jgi:hypothetical protein
VEGAVAKLEGLYSRRVDLESRPKHRLKSILFLSPSMQIPGFNLDYTTNANFINHPNMETERMESFVVATRSRHPTGLCYVSGGVLFCVTESTNNFSDDRRM